jgi:hypothetical protein
VKAAPPTRRLDARWVPRLASGAGALVRACRTLSRAPAVRLVRAALADTGFVGPGVLLALAAGCLLAATGAR